MTEVLITLISVSGTLAAGVLASLVQTRSRDRADERAEANRTNDQKADALADFASRVVDYRRTTLAAWHEVYQAREDGRTLDFDQTPSAHEQRSVRAGAWAALYRIRLLWPDKEIVTRAESLLLKVDDLKDLTDLTVLKQQGDAIRAEVGELTDHASTRLVRR
ncbi:MAG: hypothetical protein GEU93_17840 [Propionibacteriales bacterium]|nr:hypothetical protein [Propionibacteriales bacterium]